MEKEPESGFCRAPTGSFSRPARDGASGESQLSPNPINSNQLESTRIFQLFKTHEIEIIGEGEEINMKQITLIRTPLTHRHTDTHTDTPTHTLTQESIN